VPSTARIIAGHGSGKADGSADVAQFMSPLGIAADGAGNIYVADANGETLRRIKPDGSVETVAGAYDLKTVPDVRAVFVRDFLPPKVDRDIAGAAAKAK